MHRATDPITDPRTVTERALKREEHDRLWDDEIRADESARLWATLGWTAV